MVLKQGYQKGEVDGQLVNRKNLHGTRFGGKVSAENFFREINA